MKREVSPLKKHIEESPKLRALRERRIRRRRRVITALCVLFFVLLGTTVYVSRLPRIQLNTVEVVGNKVVDTDDVVSHVEKYLSGYYVYLIPHRDALIYPKQKIVADLVKSFPRFDSVAVYRTSWHTLQVTVSEVRGRALWCGETDTDLGAGATAQSCYFTDETGRIVSDAPYYSGNVYPRFFGGTVPASSARLDNENPIGTTFTDPDTFKKLVALQESIANFGFQIKSVDIGADTEDTIMIDLGSGKIAPVRFLKADNFETLEGNLSAALSNPTLANALKTDKQNLEYFDLRFTNKVYYKFSDQE
ncbi:MAG: hypothetical protein WCG55_00525 [bacterium]